MRFTRYIPSAVIVATVVTLAACVPPIKYQGPIPVPIPHVVPDENCQHWKLPGVRWKLSIPQAGVWSYDAQISNGVWLSGTPWWYNPGDGLTIESSFPIRVTWAPSSTPGTPWHIVSDVMYPHPAQLCLDY